MFLLVIMFFICFFLILVEEIFDVFMVKTMVEETFVCKNLDVIYTTDMSDIEDTTDILDCVDYISFIGNVDVVKERYWLYQYFDDFVKLFRKDRGIGIKHINYINDKLSKEMSYFDDNSGSIYKEVLKYEIFRLNELCERNIKEAHNYWNRLVECDNLVEVYRKDIRDIEIENRVLEEDLSNIRGNLVSLQVEYDFIGRRYADLYRFSCNMWREYSENIRYIQRENDWFRTNFNPQVHINLWYR